jgi:selenocysteine-specific elongation factor
MKNIILGTAGHIDHGKTSLIKALTGIDTDRLPEEKSRGITIELGFANLQITSEILIGIVDVPGHEKFVHHMVAGVGGIDLLLLVIAADEGIMPQTREHIDICQLLGIRNGLVALTKKDLVDDEWLELVTTDVSAYLQKTFLNGSPIIPVSSSSGAGLDELKHSILSISKEIPQRSSQEIFRLPADRVFTIRGFGTVVTGTVISGSIRVASTVSLVPGGPEAKIRGLQVHGQNVDTITAGQRAAVNLQNIDKDEITRGMVLCLPAELPVTTLIDAHFHLLSSVSKPLKNRSKIRLHIGTAEELGEIILLDREILKPDQSCLIQIRLEHPVTALPQDRFLIRSYSPMMTIGGGRILDPEPVKHKRYHPSTLSLLSNLESDNPDIRFTAWLTNSDIAGLTRAQIKRKFPANASFGIDLLEQNIKLGLAIEIPQSTPFYISKVNWLKFKQNIVAAIQNYHVRKPLRLGIQKEELRTTLHPVPDIVMLKMAIDELLVAKSIQEDNQLLKITSFSTQLNRDQENLKYTIENSLLSLGAMGTTYQELTEKSEINPSQFDLVFHLLLDEGTILRLPGGLLFHAEIIEQLKHSTENLIQNSGAITVGQFRDTFGISRKQAVPLLEHFDRIGLTRRKGDTRILRTQSNEK